MPKSVKIPPPFVMVNPGFRFGFNPATCLFRRHAAVQYQLDSALMRFNQHVFNPADETAVGSKRLLAIFDSPCCD